MSELSFTGYEIFILAAVGSVMLLDLVVLAGVLSGWIRRPFRLPGVISGDVLWPLIFGLPLRRPKAATAFRQGSRDVGAQPVGTTAPSPLRVLIAEDDPDTADLLSLGLSSWGDEPQETASSGPAALEAAQSHQPDVILLDINLPRLDGWEVARRLRSGGGSQGTRIVAVTGRADDESRQRSREAGIDYHLTKPVEMEELHHVLDSIRRELTATGSGGN